MVIGLEPCCGEVGTLFGVEGSLFRVADTSWRRRLYELPPKRLVECDPGVWRWPGGGAGEGLAMARPGSRIAGEAIANGI